MLTTSFTKKEATRDVLSSLLWFMPVVQAFEGIILVQMGQIRSLNLQKFGSLLLLIGYGLIALPVGLSLCFGNLDMGIFGF